VEIEYYIVQKLVLQHWPNVWLYIFSYQCRILETGEFYWGVQLYDCFQWVL